MEELKDIQGLAPISSWPLAIGWWIIIVVCLSCLGFIAWRWYKNFQYKKTWQYKSFVNLQQIEQELNNNQLLPSLIHQAAVEIRNIGMQTAEREQCAGLVGQQWLQWLQDNDPLSFNWTSSGRLLTEYQYMPSNDINNYTQLKALISAAKQWVKKC